MPIEDIQMPRAPRGWNPNSDQRRRIEADPRLRNMSQDELYAFFNKGSAPPPRRAPPKQRQEPSGGLLGATLGRVTDALAGRRR